MPEDTYDKLLQEFGIANDVLPDPVATEPPKLQPCFNGDIVGDPETLDSMVMRYERHLNSILEPRIAGAKASGNDGLAKLYQAYMVLPSQYPDIKRELTFSASRLMSAIGTLKTLLYLNVKCGVREYVIPSYVETINKMMRYDWRKTSGKGFDVPVRYNNVAQVMNGLPDHAAVFTNRLILGWIPDQDDTWSLMVTIGRISENKEAYDTSHPITSMPKDWIDHIVRMAISSRLDTMPSVTDVQALSIQFKQEYMLFVEMEKDKVSRKRLGYLHQNRIF